MTFKPVGIDENSLFPPRVEQRLEEQFAPMTGMTKSYVGLGNVDNTSDKDKPVSDAQKQAIDLVKSDILLDVKTFGAVGNGLVNDSPAINAAIAEGATSGKIVYFPKGNYRIEQPLRSLAGNLTMILSPQATISRYGNNGMFINGSQSQTTNGSSNISISGGTWDARGIPNNIDGSIICIGGGDNIRVFDCTLKNVNLSHIAEIAGCTNVTFENVKFGGYSGSATDKEAFQIERLITGGFPYFNFNAGTPCKNITIKNCTQIAPDAGYSRWAVAVGNHENANLVTSSFIKIEDNDFGACTNTVIKSDYWTSVIITGNIGNAPVGMRIKHNGVDVTNVAMARNTIVGTGNAGIILESVTKLVSEKDSSQGTYGISIQGCKDLLFDGSRFRGVNFEAVLLIASGTNTRQQESIHFQNCGVSGKGGFAFYNDAKYVTLKGCYSTAPLTEAGVAIKGTATGIMVESCSFQFSSVAFAIVAFVTNTTGKVGVSGVMYPTNQTVEFPPVGQEAQFTMGVNYPIL